MAPHSSTLAWRIPWMEEPGGLQSMGSLRVRHDWETSLSLFTFMHWRRQWHPTPVLLPGESQGRGSLVGCHLWGRTRLKWLSSSIDHLYIFGKMPLQLFCPFFNCDDSFFDMELYEFFIYSLDTDPLSFANIFSYSVGCLFVLLMVSFTVQNFLILLTSHLLIFLFSKETDPKICF